MRSRRLCTRAGVASRNERMLRKRSNSDSEEIKFEERSGDPVERLGGEIGLCFAKRTDYLSLFPSRDSAFEVFLVCR